MLLAEMREKLPSRDTRRSLHAVALRVRTVAIERTRERMCRRVSIQFLFVKTGSRVCRKELSVIWQPLRERTGFELLYLQENHLYLILEDESKNKSEKIHFNHL